MKICLINNLFPPYSRGGAEKVAYQMAHDLSLDNDIFIITSKPKTPELGSNQEFKTFYLKSSFYNIGKKNVLIRLFWHFKNIFSFSWYHQILKILEEQKPDLVITHNLMGIGFMTSQAIKLSGARHHHFLHDIQLLHPSGLMMYNKENKLDNLAAKLYQFLTRKIISSPHLIISPSIWLLQEHKKRNFFPSSETKIQPFTNNNTIKETNHYKKELTKLLFAGQVESHKGIIFLLNSFLQLATPNMILKIAGSGTLLEKAKKIAKDDKRIIFLGNLNKQELEKEMKQSDALIVPSLCYENSPLIISEARNLGLLVIASRIGGIPEAIGKNDKLFTPNSAQDLFLKIKG